MPGEEARVSNAYWCWWSNITWVCAHLGFIVHILCCYCEMVATAGNKISKHFEVAWKVARMRVQHLNMFYCSPDHNYWRFGIEFQKLFSSSCSEEVIWLGHADLSGLGSHNLITLPYTEHSQLVAESHSTLIIRHVIDQIFQALSLFFWGSRSLGTRLHTCVSNMCYNGSSGIYTLTHISVRVHVFNKSVLCCGLYNIHIHSRICMDSIEIFD